MARAVLRFANPDAMFWVHDYHFLTLADELRRRGVTQPIGFFLHTPFPTPAVMAGVPHHRELVRAMLAYDLIGFQTEEDLTNFSDYLARELGLENDRPTREAYMTHAGTRLAVFPIGINADAFAALATKSATRPEVARLRASLEGRKLAIGVDRLDYSKGLPNRFRAFDRMLELYPETRKSMSLLQVAVPSRDCIRAYRELQTELSSLVGEINGRNADVDWTPIRYLNRSFPHSVLAGFYRTAHIGLVTPFQDGMNLVAKEYVAAQNPLDPGVLVLSEFAGAARQLDAAVLVNPHDIDAVARALVRALTMSAAERRQRWTAMMTRLEESSLATWFSDFEAALAESGRTTREFPLPTPAAAGISSVLPATLASVARH
jgi:trehalose 6-phosphate synthase